MNNKPHGIANCFALQNRDTRPYSDLFKFGNAKALLLSITIILLSILSNISGFVKHKSVIYAFIGGIFFINYRKKAFSAFFLRKNSRKSAFYQRFPFENEFFKIKKFKSADFVFFRHKKLTNSCLRGKIGLTVFIKAAIHCRVGAAK